MRVVYLDHQTKINDNIALTLGTFDGVHTGHLTLIQQLIAIAKEKKLKTGLLTFEPHPRLVLGKDADKLKLLTLLDEKLERLELLDLDYIFIYKFDYTTAALEAEVFVSDVLVKQLNMKFLLTGYDHQFGKNRKGNYELLSALSTELGYEITACHAFEKENRVVSSTKIRVALANGDLALANALLGYNYILKGKVVKGKQIARQLGFPTINVQISSALKLIPKPGVYAVSVHMNLLQFRGMAYIGEQFLKPNANWQIEVNLFDFEGDVYNAQVEITMLKYIRPDAHFSNEEEVKKAISADYKAIDQFFLDVN